MDHHHYSRGAAAAAAPNTAPSMGLNNAANNANNLLSMGALRDNIHNHLRETGALSTLKTQLRTMVLTEITKSTRNAQNQQLNGAGGAPAGGSKATATAGLIAADANSPSAGTSWSMTLANRLVESHLRNTRRAYTHNIFTSECGLDIGTAGGGAAVDGELCAAIDVPFPTSTTRTASAGAAANGSGGALVPANTGAVAPGASSLPITSPLVALVSKVLHSRCVPTRQTTMVQTDDATNSAADASLTIEQKLALVDAQHALKYAHCDHASKSLQEQRFRQYKEEIEAELRKEMEYKMAQFRNRELAEVRRQEAERYQLLVSHKSQEMAEMERSVQQRMELERGRLEAARHDLEVHRQAVDKRGRDMFALAEEREKSSAHLEKLISDQKGTIQKLHLQLTQLEDLCATRAQEAESWRLRETRRAEELRRLSAEHLQELRVKDDEVAELKYKAKVMAEEYRHHMDRMSLDVRMVYQQQQGMGMGGGGNNHYYDPYAAAAGGGGGANTNRQQHPYDNAAMEANRYPDYKTLLSQGRPVGGAEGGDGGYDRPTVGLQQAHNNNQQQQQGPSGGNNQFPPLHSVAAKYLRQQQPQQQQQQGGDAVGLTAAVPPLSQQQQYGIDQQYFQQQQQFLQQQQPAAMRVPPPLMGGSATNGQQQQQLLGSDTITPPRPSSGSGSGKGGVMPLQQQQQQQAASVVGGPNNSSHHSRSNATHTTTASTTNSGIGSGSGGGGMGSSASARHVNTTAAQIADEDEAGGTPSQLTASSAHHHHHHNQGPPQVSAIVSASAVLGNVTQSENSGLSPILKLDQHNRSPSSRSRSSQGSSSGGGGRGGASASSAALSRSPTTSLPSVTRRKSPTVGLSSPSNSPTASHARSISKPTGGDDNDFTPQKVAAVSATAAAEVLTTTATASPQRPILDVQKELEERRAIIRERMATEEHVEADTRRTLYNAEATARISNMFGQQFPQLLIDGLRATEDTAYRAIMWSHSQALTLLKAQTEKGGGSAMVYANEDYGGYGGGGTLARDSDDSDGSVNIFGGKGSDDSDSDF